MKSTIAYLEIPVSAKDSIIRFIAVLSVLVIGSYISNKKFYILSNVLLSLLLTLIYTERLDYTILYSVIVGLAVFGYYNFRIHCPYNYDPYKYTGFGIAMCVVAGVSSHYISKYFEQN